MRKRLSTGPTFGQRSGAEIQAKVGLGANDFTPFHELVSTELVAFCTNPGKFGPVPIISRLQTPDISNMLIGSMARHQVPGNDHLKI